MGHGSFGKVAVFLLACACVAGCTRQEDAFGQLMLSIDSDVPPRSPGQPDGEFDRVQVEISQGEVVLLNRDWVSSAAPLTFPQSVALVNQAKDLSAPVRATITASHEGMVTFVQERIVKVPAEGTKLTSLRLEWLCRGIASGAAHRPQSGCPSGQTCRGGACQSIEANAGEESLQTPSTCFDVHACMTGAQDIRLLLDANCSMALNEAQTMAAASLNVALEALPGQGGLCGPVPGSPCLVSLPREQASGFSLSEGRLRLPPAVCQLLASGDRLGRIWLGSTCASRPATQPVCAPWTDLTLAP